MHSREEINNSLIKIGEELRNRYLYNMQEEKSVLYFLINRFNKKQHIQKNILKLVQCH